MKAWPSLHLVFFFLALKNIGRLLDLPVGNDTLLYYCELS